MAIRCKVNLLAAMKEAGYSSGRIRREHLIGEQMLQKLRAGGLPSWAIMDTVCRLLNCQPGDLLEYVPDDETKEAPDVSEAVE